MGAARHRLSFAFLLCLAMLLALSPDASASGSQVIFSTYLGGAYKYGDIGNDIAVDPAGNVYVTGRSYYSNFPVTPGAFQTAHRNLGPWDTTSFVAKFDPTGSRLIYATYLGGEGGETTGEAIAVDAAGDAYVSGYTNSQNFPTTPGALRASGSGGFVTKLNPAGSELVYSTLIGQPDTHAGSIAIDPAGNAYVAAGAVMKIDPLGSSLVYSNSFGGKGLAEDVAVDSAGDAYVAGTASSGFQTTPGAFQGSGTGAFAAKLDPSGSSLVYSTLLGTPKQGAGAIAIDATGNAYIAGRTVMKLDPSGGSLVYSNSLGGASPADIAIDAAGDAFATGATRSPRFQTTTGALKRQRAPGRRRPSTPFVSELNPAGSALNYSTYLGDDGDFASALAVDPTGHAYVTGGTISGALPVSPGAFQRHPRESDGYAAFATALDPMGPPTAGLYISSIERHGDRVRLRGTFDPAADGELLASAGQGRSRRAAHLRLDKGGFLVTTTSLGTTRALKIVLDFQGHAPWASENVCRKLRIGRKRPRRWTEIGYRDCG
jgi:sugar lactone lactonase YvrE